jgi:ADP-ribosylglycohydrolase
MSNLPTKEQFEGCLIGQCVGDALGFVVEGQPSEVCREYVEEALSEGHPGDRRRGRYAFGQYSDDLQLARELMHTATSRARGSTPKTTHGASPLSSRRTGLLDAVGQRRRQR